LESDSNYTYLSAADENNLRRRRVIQGCFAGVILKIIGREKPFFNGEQSIARRIFLWIERFPMEIRKGLPILQP
jgi:hypothetical protein